MGFVKDYIIISHIIVVFNFESDKSLTGIPLWYLIEKNISISPWEVGVNFYLSNFHANFTTDCWGISCKIAVRLMLLDLIDEYSTLVQAMARCRQATSHYLSQCWPRSMSPYGVTRSQLINTGKLGIITRVTLSNSRIKKRDHLLILQICSMQNWNVLWGINIVPLAIWSTHSLYRQDI